MIKTTILAAGIALLFACGSNPPADEEPANPREVAAEVEQAEEDGADPGQAAVKPADHEGHEAHKEGEVHDAAHGAGHAEGEHLKADAAGKLADGEKCLSADDCASGVCEGEGCDEATPGTCMPKMRPCTRDIRPYCGCDGETFTGSGNCPGQRFAYPGECKAEE